jgi:hypothetical protein
LADVLFVIAELKFKGEYPCFIRGIYFAPCLLLVKIINSTGKVLPGGIGFASGFQLILIPLFAVVVPQGEIYREHYGSGGVIALRDDPFTRA